MSGYSEDVFRNGPDMDPEIAFLGKPFTLKGLAAKVKEILDS
jgi:two-component system cell cycle sensor histidine kinase/response regulator CckA